MPNKQLHFYFDFISPYAYFAWKQGAAFCERLDLELVAHPAVFGKLLDHWGQLGPAEIPPKRAWLAKYCARYAHAHGLPFQGPKKHPFYPLFALRLALKEVSGDRQHELITTIFDAGWGYGADIGDPKELGEILHKADFDAQALAQQVIQPETKDALKASTQAAIDQGVFGVPTFVIEDQLFWGNDQFDHIEMYLSGEDPTDNPMFKDAQARERGIDRKTFLDKSRS